MRLAPPPEEAIAYDGAQGEAAPPSEDAYEDDAEYGYNEATESDFAEGTEIEENTTSPEELAASRPGKRKVHYDANVKLEVKKPADTITTLTRKAKTMGGYVESQTLEQAVLKIPVQNFFSFYRDVLKAGKVLEKSISADDITEQYSDMQLRRDVIAGTLAKFTQLLRSSQNATEKLAVLAEIRKLKERLAVLDTALAKLAKLAKYSTLTVAAVPRQTDFRNLQTSGLRLFSWIKKLSPDESPWATAEETMEWQTPKGYLKVDRDTDNYWQAETPTKAFVRSWKRQNNPKGDTTFWLKAIRYEFEQAEDYKIKTIKLGRYRAVLVTDSFGELPRTYLVAVAANDDDLQVVEAVYNSPKELKRHFGALKKTFRKGA